MARAASAIRANRTRGPGANRLATAGGRDPPEPCRKLNRGNAMKPQRGAALILALWALALLSLMMGAVVQAIRLENRQSAYELQHTKAQLAAEAGLALAI